jgi:cell division protease FtsH
MMADALIRYETIDTEQIRDIMEGREPRPPQGWSDSEPPEGGVETAADVHKPDTPPASGEIGGPASQH